jgi:LacI family transcriptional regulator
MSGKYLQVAETISRRLQNGDYLVNDFPGERKLASELGVSYLTGRKAIQHLIEKGVLPRRPVGRVTVRQTAVDHELNVAFAVPAFSSLIYNEWRRALAQVVQARNGNVRTVPYVNWNDPALAAALDGNFDGLFLMSQVEPAPELLQRRLHKLRQRVVTLFEDMTSLGIPCILGNDPKAVGLLVEHLYQLGHRQIDCFNTEPSSATIKKRIEAWANGLKSHGITGRLWDHAVQPFGRPQFRAHEAAGQLFDSHQLTASALLCTSMAVSTGVLRAAFERGVRVGHDLSVCIPDGIDDAQLMTPSLTTLKTPDMAQLLGRGLQWITTGGQRWRGPLTISNADESVVQGESTRPPANKR